MTEKDYRIIISSGDKSLTVSPDAPLRLLEGGLSGFDSTDFDVTTGSYANDHGGYVRRRRFAEREIEIRFEITEDDSLWRRRILALVNPGQDCVISVRLRGIGRQIGAVPTDRVTFDQENFYDLTVVTLRFIAPDPFLTAEESQTFSFTRQVPLLTFPMNFYPRGSLAAGYTIHRDSGVARNEGDAACGVIVTVRARGGTVVNPRISCGDAFIRAVVNLNPGDEMVIDTRKRKKGIRINGENRLVFDWKSTFFSLEAGDNALSIDADSGKEYMAVRYEYVPLYFGI